MILIIDNNEERRKNLCIWLRVKHYIVSGISYDDMDYYTKPFMTVYINPSRKNLPYIKNEDTISVIFTERRSYELPEWCINISTLKNIANEIIQIYEEKCKYQKPNKVDVLGYACMKNGIFALGGKIINLSAREKQIVSLFMYNYPKKFSLYDAANYFAISNNQEYNFEHSLYTLNKKMKDADREKIILTENDTCFLNPEIANYICPEYNLENDENDDYKGYFYENLLEDI